MDNGAVQPSNNNSTSLEPDGEQGSSSSEKLVNDPSQCDHYFGGAGYDDSLRLRTLKTKYPEDYTELGDILEGLVGNQIAALGRQKFGPTRRYLSNVVLIRDSRHHGEVVRILRNEVVNHPGKFFIWTDEGDHIHVVHDCAYPGGQCRCKIFQHDVIRGSLQKPLRRIKYASDLDKTDWENVLIYFGLSKWPSEHQIWIGGRLQRSASYDQVVRWKYLQTRSREILEGKAEGIGRDDPWGQRDGEDDRQSVSSYDGSVGTKRRRENQEGELGSKRYKGQQSKFDRIKISVHALLSKYHCLPSTHIRYILCDEDKYDYMYDPRNEKDFAQGCELFEHIHNKYSLAKFREVYSDHEPLFYSSTKDPFQYYHTREESLHYIKSLIQWQFNDDEEKIREFLTNLREWFNKFGWDGNPKMNTLMVEGPFSCGKNYFFDMLVAIAYNIGHVGQVCNKTNNFSLQSCVNRRLCVANEWSVEESAIEDMKKFCEGLALNIRVKHKADAIYTRCPVLVLTNNHIDFLHRAEFLGVRVHKMIWKQAPLLKDSLKKPYPLCLFDLFDYYNVSLE